MFSYCRAATEDIIFPVHRSAVSSGMPLVFRQGMRPTSKDTGSRAAALCVKMCVRSRPCWHARRRRLRSPAQGVADPRPVRHTCCVGAGRNLRTHGGHGMAPWRGRLWGGARSPTRRIFTRTFFGTDAGNNTCSRFFGGYKKALARRPLWRMEKVYI